MKLTAHAQWGTAPGPCLTERCATRKREGRQSDNATGLQVRLHNQWRRVWAERSGDGGFRHYAVFNGERVGLTLHGA